MGIVYSSRSNAGLCFGSISPQAAAAYHALFNSDYKSLTPTERNKSLNVPQQQRIEACQRVDDSRIQQLQRETALWEAKQAKRLKEYIHSGNEDSASTWKGVDFTIDVIEKEKHKSRERKKRDKSQAKALAKVKKEYSSYSYEEEVTSSSKIKRSKKHKK